MKVTLLVVLSAVLGSAPWGGKWGVLQATAADVSQVISSNTEGHTVESLTAATDAAKQPIDVNDVPSPQVHVQRHRSLCRQIVASRGCSCCTDETSAAAPCSSGCDDAWSGLLQSLSAASAGVQSALEREQPAAVGLLPGLRGVLDDITRTAPTIRAQLRRLHARMAVRLGMEQAIEKRERIAREMSRRDPMPTAVPRLYDMATPTVTYETLPQDEKDMALYLLAAADQRAEEQAKGSKGSKKPGTRSAATAPARAGTARGRPAPPTARPAQVTIDVLPDGAARPSAASSSSGPASSSAAEDLRQVSAVALLQARASLLLMHSQALPLARVAGIGAIEDYRCKIIKTANITLLEWLSSDPSRTAASEVGGTGTGIGGKGGAAMGPGADQAKRSTQLEDKLRSMIQAQLGAEFSLQSSDGKTAGQSNRSKASQATGKDNKGKSKDDKRGQDKSFFDLSGSISGLGKSLGVMWSADDLFSSVGLSSAAAAAEADGGNDGGLNKGRRIIQPSTGAAEGPLGVAVDSEDGTIRINPNAPLPSGYSASHCGGIQPKQHNSRKASRAGLGILSPIFNAFSRGEAAKAALVRALQLIGIVLSPIRAGWQVLAPVVSRPVRAMIGWAATMVGAAGGTTARLACTAAPGLCQYAADRWDTAAAAAAAAAAYHRVWSFIRPELIRFGLYRTLGHLQWAAGVVWDSPAFLWLHVVPAMDLAYHRAEVVALESLMSRVKDIDGQWMELLRQAEAVLPLVQAATSEDTRSLEAWLRNASGVSEGLPVPSLSCADLQSMSAKDGRALLRAAWALDGAHQHGKASTCTLTDVPAQSSTTSANHSYAALYAILAAGTCYEAEVERGRVAGMAGSDGVGSGLPSGQEGTGTDAVWIWTVYPFRNVQALLPASSAASTGPAGKLTGSSGGANATELTWAWAGWAWADNQAGGHQPGSLSAAVTEASAYGLGLDGQLTSPLAMRFSRMATAGAHAKGAAAAAAPAADDAGLALYSNELTVAIRCSGSSRLTATYDAAAANPSVPLLVLHTPLACTPAHAEIMEQARAVAAAEMARVQKDMSRDVAAGDDARGFGQAGFSAPPA